jgi:hypothetical protein
MFEILYLHAVGEGGRRLTNPRDAPVVGVAGRYSSLWVNLSKKVKAFNITIPTAYFSFMFLSTRHSGKRKRMNYNMASNLEKVECK